MSSYTYPTDPNHASRARLRYLMQRANNAVNHDESLRIAIFGDSTMTCPGGYGVLPMHHLNKRFGQMFGNIPATQLISLQGNTGAPYSWGAGQAVQATPFGSNYDPPGVYSKRVPFTGESGVYAADIGFQPWSQRFATSRQILAGSTFFPTANQRLEIYCSKYANSAESLLIEYRPTDKAYSLFEAILTAQQETLPVPGLNATATNYEVVRVRTANSYNPSVGKPYPQWWIKSGVATTVGAGSVAPPIINGVRVLNASPVGAILDTLSAGGYRTLSWFGDTLGGTPGLHENAAPQTVQLRHDVWLFTLGLNDYYNSFSAANTRRNYYDTDGTYCKGLIGKLIDECNTRGIRVPLIVITTPPFRCDDGTGATYTASKAQHNLAWTEAQGLVDELIANGYDAIARDVKAESDAMGFNATINDFQGLVDRGAHSTGSVSYSVGDFVLGTDGIYYKCVVAHTSSATNEPTDDGTNNTPIYWRPIHLHIDGAPSGTNYVHWSDKGAAIVAECTTGLFREHFAPSAAVVDSATLAAIAAASVAAFKADAALGTADGGLVAEVNKIPRAATAVTAGAAQQKHLENSLGATLQTVYEVLDGDVA